MELPKRITFAGQAIETRFDCPHSQFVIADALGLTSIHVKRVIQQLREMQLLKKGKAGFQGAPECTGLETCGQWWKN